MAGLMNTVGWLVGGASGPYVVGYLADLYGFGPAISSTAAVYLAAALALIAAMAFIRRDIDRLPERIHQVIR
jgi:hypothetical protein